MKRLTTKIDDTYTCSYCENQEAVDKLGMLEDFLQETGIMDLSELKQILTTNIVWQENEQLKDRWQKVKEYIDDELELIETIKDPIEQYEYWCLEGAERTHKLIKDKMQELEKDDE